MFRIVFPISSALVLLAIVPGAQNYKLSELYRNQGTGIGNFATAGGWTVFVENQTPFSSLLWGVPNDRSRRPILLHDSAAQGQLTSFQISPDGTHVVYTISTNRVRLHSIATDGSGGRRTLNGPLEVLQGVGSFTISPDSTRVAFTVANELFSRAIDASTPLVKLSGFFLEGGGVRTGFRFSPDSAWIVWRADQQAFDVIGLYSAPADGSGPTRRLDPHRPLADVQADFAIAWDSRGVVYRSDQDSDEVFELYAVPIDGAFAPMKRNAALVGGGDVLDFRLAPAGERLLYRADQDTNESFELFSTLAIAGGTPLQISATLPANGRVTDMELTPDGAHALYRTTVGITSRYELRAVPSDGSGPALLLHPSSTESVVGAYRVSPDGARVAFDWNPGAGGAKGLYSAPVDASAPPVLLSLPLTGTRRIESFFFAQGGARVAYLADQRYSRVVELFSAPMDGSQASVNLNRRLATEGDVTLATLAADGEEILYLADQRTRDAQELFSVAVDASAAPIRMSVPLEDGLPHGRVAEFSFVDGGRDVLYHLIEPAPILDGPDEFRRVSLDGGPSTSITSPRGDEILQAVSPDGKSGIFLRGGDDGRDLVRIALDGSSPEVWLDQAVPAGGSGGSFWPISVSPDSRHALFITDQANELLFHLYSAPLDGSGPARRLSSSGASSAYPEYDCSPDGSRLVFQQQENSAAPLELFSAATDGSLAPLRISGPMPTGGGLGGATVIQRPEFTFRVTPDGTRAVYAAEQENDGLTELHVAPLDGLSPPIELSGVLQPDGDVRLDGFYGAPFLLTPDSQHVLYVADAVTDGVFELFRAPLSGASAPVKLSGTLVVGGTVGGAYEDLVYLHESMALTPDGQHVVYMADATSDEVTELYSVRIDGSSAPVRLNLPLSGAYDVYTFLIAPTSDRVVFTAGEPYWGSILYSAPIDGSTPAVQLATPVAVGDTDELRFTPDGTRILFTGALDSPSSRELYARVVDGSSPAVKLSGPLVSGGNVAIFGAARFAISPDGSRVVYIADQERDEVPELYASFLGRGPGPSARPGPDRLR